MLWIVPIVILSILPWWMYHICRGSRFYHLYRARQIWLSATAAFAQYVTFMRNKGQNGYVLKVNKASAGQVLFRHSYGSLPYSYIGG